MSESTTDKKPAGRLSRWLAAPRRWSIATWATIALSVFLWTCLFVCWGIFQFGYHHVPWQHYMTWPRFLLVLGLLVTIPFVFHYGLRLWLQGEAARFPELNKAWNAGLHALREAGISLEGTPVYLVLGSHSEPQEKAIMNANSTPLQVAGVPAGPAFIRWYANSESIYIFCSDSSWLSALNQLRRVREEEEDSQQAESLTISAENAEPWSAAPAPPARAAAPSGQRAAASLSRGQPQHRGTIMLDQFISDQDDDEPSTAAPTPAEGSRHARGTLLLDAPVATSTPAAARPSSTATESMGRAPVGTQRLPVIVPPRDSAIRLQRLQSVCQLLRSARQPLCPINGVLTLLPFATIHATAEEMEELERAAKCDLGVLQRELSLRAPVTALVVGLENEAGFREFVRRVGREKAMTQRFGGRYDLRASTNPEELRAFSAHVCGAFEDWAYTLFREKDALSRPGNTRLYNLLCKVRCIMKNRLGKLLGNGFGYDEHQATCPQRHLFSGCYFAAAGRSADRQAFLQGVLDKLISEQEQIEWTDQAIQLDRRFQRLAYAGLAVDAALACVLAVRAWWVI